MRWSCGVAPALLVVVCAVAPASAQSQADLERAREAYRAGLALETAGDWSGALAKFRDVASVKLTPQVRFHMARCQDKLGRWTEAIGTYRQALGEAEAAGIGDVVRESTAALAALEPQVPMVRIELGEGTAGATVALDGVQVGAASLGTDVRVDPGRHIIEAFVNRERRFSRTLELSPRARERVVVTIPLQGDGASAQPAGAERGDGSGGPNVVAYGLLGLGVVGVALAGVFWGVRASAAADLEERCVDERCPPELEGTYDRANTFTGLAIASAATGAVALGAGAVLLLGGGGDPSAAAAHPTTGLALRRPGALLTVGGSF